MITLKVITITGTVISIISLSATIVGLIVFKLVKTGYLGLKTNLSISGKLVMQVITKLTFSDFPHSQSLNVAIIFRQIRSVLTNRVHIGLSISLLIAYLALLIGPERVDDEGW